MDAVRRYVIVILAAVSAAACAAGTPGPDVTEEFRQLLHAGPATPLSQAVWGDVSEFYKRRDNVPAWISDTGPSRGAWDALEVLRSAADHGLSPADYGEPDVARLFDQLGGPDPDRARRLHQLVELDARLTTGLAALGRDVAIGHTAPAATDPRWKLRRAMPDVVSAIARAHDAGFRGWLDSLAPVQPQYAALRHALADARARARSGDWPRVPPVVFKRGQSNAAVASLRQRLIAGGEFTGSPAADTAAVYDQDLESAVRAFQNHHGLHATGLADVQTIAAMNVPIGARLAQLGVNLDRWRSMPDDFGSRYLLVNIPAYELDVRDQGKTVLHMRAIVGKTGHETPVFSATMTTVVLSPYWNIPDTIVAGETAPAVARDRNYLEHNGIEILRITKSGTRTVDPSDVHWNDPEELRQLAFRQRPGEKNALGHVKFLFPNEYDVYLHDTPADSLFARNDRALSHGCVRLEEPEALAYYLLRDDPEWDEGRIREAMNGGVERQVKLRQTIPVHIVYFTAWVDESGGLHFLPDVYGYDKGGGL